MMSEWEETEAAGAAPASEGGGGNGGGAARAISMRKPSKDESEAFMSASDLSSSALLDPSLVATRKNSVTDSIHSSCSGGNASNNTSQLGDSSSMSSSQGSSSSSSSGGKSSVGGNNNKPSYTTAAATGTTPTTATSISRQGSEESPGDANPTIFATCSATATAASHAVTAGGSVRKSESWNVLRSGSFESKSGSESGGRNADDSSPEEGLSKGSHHPPALDSYHTPSTSVHNIVSGGRRESLVSLKEGNNETLSPVPDEDEEVSNKSDEKAELDDSCGKESADTRLVEEEEPEDASLYEEASEKRGSATVGEQSLLLSGELTQSTESNGSKESNVSGSSINKVPVEPVKSIGVTRGKPTKKRMWYQQIFSTSYKSRSGDFKKLFKDLPGRERLLVGKFRYFSKKDVVANSNIKTWIMVFVHQRFYLQTTRAPCRRRF
jgi:hypothetical protein